jgi:hypothetical protein
MVSLKLGVLPMRKITVVGRDNANRGYEKTLIYTFSVESLDESTVLEAFERQRLADLGKDCDRDCEILFAFDGDLETVADWR